MCTPVAVFTAGMLNHESVMSDSPAADCVCCGRLVSFWIGALGFSLDLSDTNNTDAETLQVELSKVREQYPTGSVRRFSLLRHR